MASVSPALFKLAQELIPQIKTELKKLGLPVISEDLNETQLTEAIRKSEGVAESMNRLDQLQQGRTLSDKDSNITSDLSRLLDLVEQSNQGPLSDVGEFAMTVIGPGKFKAIAKLMPKNITTTTNISESYKKVANKINQLPPDEKADAAKKLLPQVTDDIDVLTRGQAVDVLNNPNASNRLNMLYLNNINSAEAFGSYLQRLIKPNPGKVGAGVGSVVATKVDPAEEAGRSFMKKSGLNKGGGLNSALERIKSDY